MSTLVKPQARIPLAWVVINGTRVPAIVEIEWDKFYSTLVERAGGISGVSTTELVESSFEDAGIQEAQALAYSSRDAIDQLPQVQIPAFADAPDNTAELSARISILETALQDLKQGLML